MGALSPRRATLLRLAAFTAVAVVMTFPRLDRLATHLPGDPGDPFFNYVALAWGADRFPHLLRGFWAGPMFAGLGYDAMAFSETHLGLVPLAWLLSRVTGSLVVTMNLLALATWVVSCEATFRLARRLTGHGPASVVAALGFTYATIRLGQYGHFQLGLGAFVPLVVLLAVRMLEAPRVREGLALGAAWAAMTLSASYYGLFTGICLVVLLGGHLLITRPRRRADWRPLVAAWGAAAAVALTVVGPVALQYVRLQQDPFFRRGYEAQFAARWADLGVVVPGNRLYGALGWFQNREPPTVRTGENFAFPGAVALGAGAVGLVVATSRRRWLAAGLAPARRRELALVGACSSLGFLLAFGRNLRLGGWRPVTVYDLFAGAVPGFEGIRALVRMLLFAQLGLALLAAVGLAGLLRWLERRRARSGLVVGLLAAALTLAETATRVDLVTVPDRARHGTVNELLATRPPGIAVDVPMAAWDNGNWAFSEAPRLVLATIDRHPRLNGYSGFWPPDHPAITRVVNALPDAASIDELRVRRVRYLVIRTRTVLDADPPYADIVRDQGRAWVAEADAERIVAGLAALTARVDRVPGAVLVELRPWPA